MFFVLAVFLGKYILVENSMKSNQIEIFANEYVNGMQCNASNKAIVEYYGGDANYSWLPLLWRNTSHTHCEN